MKSLLCCFKGESSNQGAHDHDLPDVATLLENCGVTLQWVDIVDGTQDFRRVNFIGEGNFGEVFRCDFPRDNIVGAAKIQKLNNPFARGEFIAEVQTLHRANHPNVIRLLGKAYGPSNWVIVYEFMPNRSLDRHLIARREVPVPGLDWETRMKIAIGVAEGLVYLHNELKVIHRDIKVANVLLDENFVPKLTDFGLASPIVRKSSGFEKECVIKPVKGTTGNAAPETENYGLVSTKSDVYCYGVLLFQLFTGRKADDTDRPVETRTIAKWVMSLWKSREENIESVVDATLNDRYSVDGLQRLFMVASMCISSQVSSRPNMDVVEQMVRQAAAYTIP